MLQFCRQCFCFFFFAGQSRLLPCTTSPDPDLSQSVSDSQQHTVVADQRGGAQSGIKLHCISSNTKKEEKKGGSSLHFQTSNNFTGLLRGSLRLCVRLWTGELKELKQERCQQIICEVLCQLRRRKKRRHSLQVLETSQHSID